MTRSTRLAATLIGFAVIAAACGSDGGSDGDDATASETPPGSDTAVPAPDDGGLTPGGGLTVSEVVFASGVATITNTGDEAIDLGGHWLCNRPTYVALPDQTLEPGATVQIVLGGLETGGGEVALYDSRDFGNTEAILDYVTWGSGGGRQSVAEGGGRWSGSPVEPDGAVALALVGDPGGAAGWASSTPSAPDDGDSPAGDQGSNESEAGDNAVVDSTADWSVERVGTGIKPALAIGSDGRPSIAYLTEAIEGGVFFAERDDAWTSEAVAEGYFYGPLDLAFDLDDRPNIVYHDHQATTFLPDAGDLTLARRVGGAWTLSASDDAGHDGWDSAIRIGPAGELWAAGIEPIDFGTQDGVEFYELSDGDWQVTSIGSPPITYQFNVAMATDITGDPVLVYYDDGSRQARLATRSGGAWTDEAVNEPGTGGMFSSLVISDDGTRHLTYYVPDTGSVVYAIDDGSGWHFETIHDLTEVKLGMTGARRITSLQLLDDGTPAVATTDPSGVWLSTRGADGWTTELVLEAGDRPLGQQVQLVVADDVWRLVTFEVTNPSPLEGEILYLERTN